jgi:hypothetical protein
MTGRKPTRGRFAAAERFTALRILEARLAQVGTERTLVSEDEKKAAIESEIASLDAYRRAIAATESQLSAAHLEQTVRYRAWVTERLDAQLATAEEARRAHESNLDRTRACVRERSAIERACRRRDQQLVVEEAQRAQKLLDSQANMKLAAARARGGVTRGGNHGD